MTLDGDGVTAAIDEDWSALRVRRAEHIRTMARNPAGAMSEAGKRETSRGRRGGRRSGLLT